MALGVALAKALVSTAANAVKKAADTKKSTSSSSSNNSNYTRDAEGKWYLASTGEPLGTGGTNEEWANAKKDTTGGGGTSLTKKGTTTDYGTYKSDLNKLTKAQQQAQVDALKAARTSALANLDAQEQTIKPYYENARNQTSAASQQGARSFAEYLANRGLTNSGAAAQGEINRLSALNNNLGNINTAEANAYRDIANQRTAVENDYVANLANANNNLATSYYNNLLNYNEQQRQYIQALQQQALGQYSNDYQAYMNTLDPNSLEYLQAAAARGNKVANQYSNAQANALASIQAGNINYNNAAALGWTVQQAQDYYNNLLAQQAEAQRQAQAQALLEQQQYQDKLAQQEWENNYKLQQLANDTAKTNYDINKPYNTTIRYISTGGKEKTVDESPFIKRNEIEEVMKGYTKASEKADYLDYLLANNGISDDDYQYLYTKYRLPIS